MARGPLRLPEGSAVGRGSRALQAQRGLAPASPVKRNVRRARGLGREEEGKEAAGKVRRRKTTAKVQEKGSSLALVPYRPSNLTRGANNDGQKGCEGLWEMVGDLVMWNNVARSACWFGSGSMVFISASLSRDISPVSVSCHFSLVILGLAFIKDSIFEKNCNRERDEPLRPFQLTDEDVRRAARVVLPIVNPIISLIQSGFSGDASMTLKVLPILLFGAKFGHLLTTWRLLATAKGLKDWILNAWKSCQHKKLVMAVAMTTCWNLLSVKTRIFAAFFCLVTLHYYYQHCGMNTRSQRGINRTLEKIKQ